MTRPARMRGAARRALAAVTLALACGVGGAVWAAPALAAGPMIGSFSPGSGDG